METLFEKFIRLKREELLKKMALPLSAFEEENESVITPLPGEGELRQQAQQVVDRAEQFFAQFGFAENKQEELFQMPIIQQHLDEIITNVLREREELERTIGKPRDGWDPLPFEKIAATEKILQKLPQENKIEPVKEIFLDKIFDTSAEEQILAIQQRLSESLESVQKTFCAQKKDFNLSPLPKRENLIEPLIELPDLQEKQPIALHTQHHYADELKVTIAAEDPLKKVIDDTNLLRNTQDNLNIDKGALSSESVDGEKFLTKNELLATPASNHEIRPTEAIVADIEKMTKHINKTKNTTEVVVPEVIESAREITSNKNAETSNNPRKSKSIRPTHGVVISALKSKIYRAYNESSNIEVPTINHEKDSSENLLLDISLHPSSALPTINFNRQVEMCNEETEKILAMQRRQNGLRKFHL